MNTYSHVIWDFNGTLLDDVQAAVQSENVLLSRRNMKQIESIETYRQLFQFPVEAYYRELGHNFALEPFEDIAKEWVEQYLLHSKMCALNPGVLETLKCLSTMGIPQIILSATEENMLRTQVDALGISSYFEQIFGLDSIHATSKVTVAEKWKNATNPKHPIFIGDTTHDFEVAQAIGGDCVLVACGHQSKERLQTCGARVLDGIGDILKEILGGTL